MNRLILGLLVFVWVQAPLFFSAHADEAVTVATPDQTQINRAAYVGAAMYNSPARLHPENLILARAVSDFIDNNPHVDLFEVMKIAKQALTNYQNTAQTAAGSAENSQTIREVSKTLSEVVKTAGGLSGEGAPIADKLADTIESLGKGTAWAYDQTFAPIDQINAARENYDAINSLDPDKIWGKVFDLGQNPAYGPVINSLFSKQVGAQTNQSASDIADENPQVTEFTLIKGSLAPGGSVDQFKTAVTNGMSQVQSNLSTLENSVMSDDKNLEKQVNTLSIEYQSAQHTTDEIRSMLQKQADEKKKQEDDQRLIDGEKSAVYVMSTMAGIFGDKKLGQDISVVGNAAITIASTVSKFSSLTATTAGTAIMTGNVLGAVMSVASLFGGGPSPDELIMQQIQQLSKQIDALQKNMNDRFDHVDKTLEAIITGLNNGFAQLAYNNQQIEDGIAQLQQSLQDQRVQINLLDQDLRSRLDSQAQDDFNTELGQCFPQYNVPGIKISDAAYANCLVYFNQHALGTSLRTDPRLADTDSSPFLSLPARLESSTLEENFPFLAELSAVLFGHGLDPSGPISLPNIDVWANNAQAYMNMLAINPVTPESHLPPSDRPIRDLFKMGGRLHSDLISITSSAAPVSGPSSSFFDDLVAKYQEKLLAFSVLVEQTKTKFQQDPSNKIPASIDLWKDGAQLPVLSQPVTMGPCPEAPRNLNLSYTGKLGKEKFLFAAFNYYSNFPIPKNIPNAIENSAQLGLGDVQYCYLLYWDPVNAGKSMPDGTLVNQATLSLDVIARAQGQTVYHRRVSSPTPLTFPYLVHADAPFDFNPATNPNLREFDDFIKSNWTGGANILHLYETSSTDLTDDAGKKAMTQLSQKVADKLSTLRQAIRTQVVQGMSAGAIKEAAEELTGAKDLVEAYVKLGLPQSWSQDDYLRMLFHGSEQVFDESALVDYLTHNDQAEHLDQLMPLASKRSDALKKELDRLVQTQGGKEVLPTIQNTMDRLTNMIGDLDSGKVPRSLK